MQAERSTRRSNFEAADTERLFRHFSRMPKPGQALLERAPPLVLPAYDQCLKASHLFNLLDARGVISATEQAAYIARVRALARGCCTAWLRSRGHLGAEAASGDAGAAARASLQKRFLRMQERAAADLGELVGRSLTETDLRYDQISAFATPRRLTLRVRGLPAMADSMVERRGPRVGAQAALHGFTASLGVSDYTLEEQDDRKGRVHVARYRRAGRSTAEVLVTLVGIDPGALSVAQSMRWGDHEIRWIRPLRSILCCLFDGDVVPVEFGPLRAGAITLRPSLPRAGANRGAELRGLLSRSWRLPTSGWTARIGAGDRDRRRIARDEDLRLREDPALLAELAGLVDGRSPCSTDRPAFHGAAGES